MASIQAQLTSVSSPAKLGKNGILTITDSGILKPTDHNQTQGGIGTDVSRIGKIWGTFMDLNDDVSINGKLDLSGKLTANGVVVLGNNDGDTIEVGGRFTSNLVPSQNNAVDIGTTSLRWRTGYFVNSIVVGSGTTTITDTGITTTGGSSTTITSSLLNLVSTGTLQLDTSTNNNNILLLTGTGNIGIGSTAPVYKLDVAGTGHYTGAVTFDSSISVSDLACTDCLDFDSFEDSLDMDADTVLNGDYSLILRAGAGAIQNSTSGSNDLQLSAEDKLIFDAASFTLSTSNGPVDILSRGYLDLSSTGTLTLDTSQNNSNILLKAGSGSINLSSGTTTISGNVNLNSGTLTLNGVAYTFPGTQTANGVLLTDGSGILSWTTGLTGASLADDTLDFADFQDELDLDADTSINGDYSLILRAGLGSIQNSTSGSNDLQLSAEDKLILGAASFDLLTSSGGIDMISGSYMDLSSKGTLTLDTSQNNTDINIWAGSGSLNLSAATARLTGNLIVTGTETFNGIAYTFPGTQTASGVLTTDGAGILSWGTIGAANITADSLDFAQFDDSLDLDADTSINGPYSFIIRSGNAARQNATSGSNDLQLSAEDQVLIHGSALLLETSSASAGQLVIRSDGTLQLDTSANNTNIALQAGSGNINLSSTGTITLTGNTSLNNGTLRLNGLTYTFPGTDTANGVLISNGSGLLSWNTIGQSNITADSLDFSEFKDTLTMDSDTAINGDYSLIVRAGLGSIQNSTSGSNDLQLSAEDKLIFDAASLTLTTSNGPIDILSRGYLDLSSTGTLTLDTSQNNTNILLKAGSGSINLSSGTTTISGNLNLNSGTLTLNGVAYTFPGADGSASQALTTNASGILSWSTIGVSADSLDFTDLKDTLTMDSDTAVNGDYSFILRAGLGAVQDLTSGSNDIMAAAEDQMFFRAAGFNLTTSSAANSSIILRSASGGIQLSTGSASLGEMRLLSSGSLVLDTSLNNSNIRLQAGSGRIDLSGGTILVNSGTGTLTLSSESGVTVGGSLAATGNLNSAGGGLQTNGVTRVSNSGAVSASALTMDTSPGKFTFQNGFYLQNISPTSLGMYDTGLNLVVTFDEE